MTNLKVTLEYKKGIEHSFFIGTMDECLKEQIKLKKQGYFTKIYGTINNNK